MSGFQLQRLGMLMEPEPGNPQEIEGVLNPAATRGPDGKLYLFPRLVAKSNYSRIGIARVKFNEAGDPSGVERLGIALEPEADYERRSDGSGGCEDARVTFVEPLQHYVMTYTALSPSGPRIALAMSEDLFHWERIGLATFEPFQGIDFVHVDNKDAQTCSEGRFENFAAGGGGEKIGVVAGRSYASRGAEAADPIRAERTGRKEDQSDPEIPFVFLGANSVDD